MYNLHVPSKLYNINYLELLYHFQILWAGAVLMSSFSQLRQHNLSFCFLQMFDEELPNFKIRLD